MKSFLKWAGAAALAFTAATAEARFVVADYAGKGIDYNKTTHVLVAARGTDMGLQFHMTASSQARKIMDVNPNDQVVLLSVMEDLTEDTDEAKLVKSYLKNYGGFSNIESMLKQWGFGQFRYVDTELRAESFMEELMKFRRIGSLNVYSHSTAYYGLILDSPLNRIDPKRSQVLTPLKSRFVPGAYAWFHGCNTGQSIVRDLSEQWGIPVAGAYTSTAFQEIFKDSSVEGSNFYHGYETNPPNIKENKNGKLVPQRMGVNKLSFKKTYTCDKVPCVRMMPDNIGYSGYWGDFMGGGLNIYRFTCSSKSIPNKDICYSTMARALINQVSDVYTDMDVDLATFKRAAQDHICPRVGGKYAKAGYTYEACAQALEQSLTNPNVTVDPFKTTSLNCLSNGDCQFAIKCDEDQFLSALGGFAGAIMNNQDMGSVLVKKSCKLTNKKNPSTPNRTLVDEYAKYIKGYEILQRSKR